MSRNEPSRASHVGRGEPTGRAERASRIRRAVHRPTLLGGAASVAAGVLAVALVASSGPQHRALGIEVAGLVAIAVGIELRHREHGLVGVVVALGGVGIAGAAMFAGSVGVSSLAERVELLPGMAGLVLLVAGVSKLRSGWERHLVTAGTALILVSAVGSGVVLETASLPLLASVVATVVAWDVGEQAINLGEQVGRQAETHSVELVHGLGGVAVGAVAVGLAVVVQGNAITGIPLAALAALLGAGVVLMLALYS